MAEAIVQINEGTGKKLWGFDWTVGANTVISEAMHPAPYPYATYNLFAENISSATAAAHVAQLMAGGTNKCRIIRITVTETAAPAGALRIEVVRLTTAGTGGGAITARPNDPADTAGATGMQLPTVKGTESLVWGTLLLNTITAAGIGTVREWRQSPGGKPLIIPAGTTNGIALKTSGLAASTVDWEIEFVETPF